MCKVDVRPTAAQNGRAQRTNERDLKHEIDSNANHDSERECERNRDLWVLHFSRQVDSVSKTNQSEDYATRGNGCEYSFNARGCKPSGCKVIKLTSSGNDREPDNERNGEFDTRDHCIGFREEGSTSRID